MKIKLTYAIRSILRRIGKAHEACPSCGSHSYYQMTAREFKKFPTSLRYCNTCSLFYRYPTTLEHESKKFYEIEYQQDGLTTDLPGESEFNYLVETNFVNSEKDFSDMFYIIEKVSDELGKKLRILDYGANWGYAVSQFKKLNCVDAVYGYEYSDTRRRYGEDKLGVEYISENEFGNDFDLVISSHVIEHMYNPSLFKVHMDRLLVNRGFVVITCPNGSVSALFQDPPAWRSHWGSVHPNFISDLYLTKQFYDYEGCIFDATLNGLTSVVDISNLSRPPVSRLPQGEHLLGVFRAP